MSSKDNRIYHSRRPLKTFLTVFFSALALLLALAIFVFVSFRKYIVYTSDGVRLDVPWLQDTQDTQEDAGGADPAVPDAPEESNG